MLYHIKSYDSRTGVAFGVLASQYDPRRYYASGNMDSLFSPKPLDLNSPHPYSFKPEHKFVNGILTIGVLDEDRS
jgi:hypothetical protein